MLLQKIGQPRKLWQFQWNLSSKLRWFVVRISPFALLLRPDLLLCCVVWCLGRVKVLTLGRSGANRVTRDEYNIQRWWCGLWKGLSIETRYSAISDQLDLPVSVACNRPNFLWYCFLLYAINIGSIDCLLYQLCRRHCSKSAWYGTQSWFVKYMHSLSHNPQSLWIPITELANEEETPLGMIWFCCWRHYHNDHHHPPWYRKRSSPQYVLDRAFPQPRVYCWKFPALTSINTSKQKHTCIHALQAIPCLPSSIIPLPCLATNTGQKIPALNDILELEAEHGYADVKSVTNATAPVRPPQS